MRLEKRVENSNANENKQLMSLIIAENAIYVSRRCSLDS